MEMEELIKKCEEKLVIEFYQELKITKNSEEILQLLKKIHNAIHLIDLLRYPRQNG